MEQLKLNGDLNNRMNKVTGVIRCLVYFRTIKDNINEISLDKFILSSIEIKNYSENVSNNPDEWNDHTLNRIINKYKGDYLLNYTNILNDDSYWINGNYYLCNKDLERILQEFEVPADTFKLYVDQLREAEKEKLDASYEDFFD
ncbi:hypothetical protein ACYATO_08780 [Lactobacillaceae bacterium Melli_B3]